MFRFASIISLVLGGVFFSCLLVLPVHAQISIGDARSQGVGATVTVEGTVTRAYGDFVRLQDESGPTGASGLVVRQTSGEFQDDVADGTIEPGTQLQVSGTLSEFNGLLQINNEDLSSYTVQGQGEVPAPQEVSLSELAADGEDYESELVEVTELSVQGEEGTFENETSYTVADSTGVLTFRVQDVGETELGGTSIPEGAFDYSGVVGEFNDDYQLIPVREDDVQPGRSFSFARQFAQVQEDGGTVEVTVRAFNMESGDEVEVTARAGDESTADNDVDVSGFDSPETITFQGGDPAPQTLMFTPVDDGEEEGVERLEVVLETDAGGIAAPGRFTLWSLDDATAQGPVAEGDSGNTLIGQLQDTYGNPPTLGYDIARDSLYRRVYNENGVVEGFYTGYEAAIDLDGGDASDQALDQNVNTEHLWPQSYGAGREPAQSDMHILVPSRDAVNSARSNYPFDEIPDTETDRWFFEEEARNQAPPEEIRDEWSELDSSPPREDRRFEPRHSVKGDVARAMFYFVTVYPNRADLSFYETQKETLLDWHRQDPVDSTEMRRNVIQASYQGNKLNPFVVDSTLVDRAYGSGEGEPGGETVSISEARDQGIGAAVTVEGTVTRVHGSYVRLQDESGPTGASGLVVRQTSGEFQDDIADGTIEPGTVLEITGTLSEFNGLLQINNEDLSRYTVQGQGEVPAPQEVSLSDLAADGEDYESELVEVPGLTFPSASGSFDNGTSYTVEDADGTTLTFRVQNEDETQVGGEPIPDGPFDYEGVVGEFNGEYQLIPVSPSDLDAQLDRSGDITIDIEQSFGDASEPGDYRLVALPGAVDRSLSDVLPGEPNSTWQAYWDDGTDSDYLIEFDESDDRFRFQPGRGFWVTSTEEWTVQEDVEPVPLDAGQATTLPLNDGWTILSNPFGRAVAWSVVAAENGIDQPLWRFDAEEGFVQADTMLSAKSGTAYYFANENGREVLTLPYPVADKAAPAEVDSSPHLSLTAVSAGDSGSSSTVQIGLTDEADRAVLAPPGRFEPVSLRIEAERDGEEKSRSSLLMSEQRPLSGEGETFDLRLTTRDDRPVELHVDNLSAVEGHEVLLLRPEGGQTHDLRTDGQVRVEPRESDEEIFLQVAIGTEAYVEQQADQVVPEDVMLTTYPNPVRQQGTIEYALPDAQDVNVEVYDVLGRQVTLLEDGRKEAGRHQVQFDSDGLSSGVYFVRLQTRGQTLTRKITVVR